MFVRSAVRRPGCDACFSPTFAHPCSIVFDQSDVHCDSNRRHATFVLFVSVGVCFCLGFDLRVCVFVCDRLAILFVLRRLICVAHAGPDDDVDSIGISSGLNDVDRNRIGVALPHAFDHLDCYGIGVTLPHVFDHLDCDRTCVDWGVDNIDGNRVGVVFAYAINYVYCDRSRVCSCVDDVDCNRATIAVSHALDDIDRGSIHDVDVDCYSGGAWVGVPDRDSLCIALRHDDYDLALYSGPLQPHFFACIRSASGRVCRRHRSVQR
jgi:hypothetical protein